MYAYNHECRYNRRIPNPDPNRKPFIVFEGNHRTSKLRYLYSVWVFYFKFIKYSLKNNILPSSIIK